MGILGNQRLQVLPIWELDFTGLPEEARPIATERLKWSMSYQKKHGIMSGAAKDLPEPLVRKIGELCKRVYRSLMLSGYARIDLRLAEDGRIVVLEANPNPQLAYGEDFAEAAEKAGSTTARSSSGSWPSASPGSPGTWARAARWRAVDAPPVGRRRPEGVEIICPLARVREVHLDTLVGADRMP